jgi:hypothetical protein
VLERRKGEMSVLRGFEEAGNLVVCKEFDEDVADIPQLAQRIDENGLLQAVALDPFGLGAIVDALDEVGISGQDRIVGISQRWKLTGAIKTAERKLAETSHSEGFRFTLKAWTGRSMFLSARLPRSSKVALSRPATASWTVREITMPPAGASDSRRAATLAPSPYRSSAASSLVCSC